MNEQKMFKVHPTVLPLLQVDRHSEWEKATFGGKKKTTELTSFKVVKFL